VTLPRRPLPHASNVLVGEPVLTKTESEHDIIESEPRRNPIYVALGVALPSV